MKNSVIFALPFRKLNGRLAQLVQSTSFTPRGSGVRIPQRPQLEKSLREIEGFFCLCQEKIESDGGLPKVFFLKAS